MRSLFSTVASGVSRTRAGAGVGSGYAICCGGAAAAWKESKAAAMSRAPLFEDIVVLETAIVDVC